MVRCHDEMGRKGLYLMFVIIIKKSTTVDFDNGAGDGI